MDQHHQHSPVPWSVFEAQPSRVLYLMNGDGHRGALGDLGNTVRRKLVFRLLADIDVTRNLSATT